MWCQFISDHFIANSKKTQAMILGNSAQEPALCVGDFPIKINHFSNILGIYINNKLSFKDHISATISVYVEIEALLRCLKNFVLTDFTLILYEAYILPHLE